MNLQSKSRSVLFGVAAMLTCAACGDRNVRTPEIGPPVTLQAPAPFGSSTPSLVTLADGAALLSWTERLADSSVAIRMATWRDGKWDSTRTIIAGRTFFVNWADFTSVTPLNNGDIAAHWLERESSGKYAYGVRVARSSDAGRTWSAPVTPHTDGLPAEHGFVSLWPDSADGLGLAWLDGRKSAMKDSAHEMTLRTAVVAPDGTLHHEAVLDARTCDCCQVASARTSTGPLVVYRDRSTDEIRDIVVVRQAGGAWSAPQRVHADNWHIEGCPVNGPQVVARGDTVAVTWFTGANDTSRVLFARSLDGGVTFDAPVRVDDGNPLGRVTLAFDRDGQALVGWMERKTPETAEVRVRRIANGVRSPAQTVATTSSARQSGFPRMVVTGDTLLIAWTDVSPSLQVRVAQLPLLPIDTMKRLVILAGALLLPALLDAQDAPKPQTVPAAATTLPLKFVAKQTSAAISVEDLMSRLYVFADDSMMGREVGTLGSVKATEYLAAEAKRIGLKPAGDNGTYFQNLPLKSKRVDPMSTFIAGTASLTFGKDWAINGQSTLNKENVEAVYGGVYGDTVNRITPEQAAGKLLLLSVPLSNEAINAALSATQPLLPASAAAVAFLVPSQVMPQLAAYVHGSDVTVVDGPPEPLRLFLGAGVASVLFTKPLNQLVVGDVGAKVAINAIVTMTDSPFAARNVVGILPGSDPKLKEQYVAVGAHSDHVGMSPQAVDHDSLLIFNRIVRPGGAEDGQKPATPDQVTQINTELAAMRASSAPRADSVFNGADDDGSGSVSVLEIAEYLSSLKTKPKRSTLFVWHVGEEKGLWGSHYFTEHPTVPRDSIVAQLNIDMVGRGSAADQTGMDSAGKELRGGPDYLQLVGSRRLSSELGDLVERVNTSKGHKFTFDYAMDSNGHPMNIYCRSDHYEYAKWNIPVTFFTTGGHSAYHQLTDEPQYIDYPHLARVAKLVSDVAFELGNSPKRPLVNGARMDPKGVCRQ